MTPRELLVRLHKNAGALMQMGALEFAAKGRGTAKLVVDDLLLFLAHLQQAGSVVEGTVASKFAEMEQRIDALEKGSKRPVLRAVKQSISGGDESGNPNGSGT